MSSRRAWKLAALAIIVVVGMVCASGLGVKPSSAASMPLVAETVVERDGIRFALTLQKVTFGVGEPVNITLTVTNISNQTITVMHSAFEFSFIVYGVSNQCVYQWSLYRVFPLWLSLLPLNPGDSLAKVMVWPQTCNQTVTDPEGGLSVLPGRYFIVGYYYGAPGIPTLQTPPSEVHILAPLPIAVTIGLLLGAPVVILLAVVLLARKK